MKQKHNFDGRALSHSPMRNLIKNKQDHSILSDYN